MDVIERSLKTASCKILFHCRSWLLRYDDEMPSQAADLVTEENVHTAVNGIVHDEDEELEVVIGSLRTTKLTLILMNSLKKPWAR